MHLKTRILLLGCCFFILNAHGQADFRRDSIHTDRGVPNTLDFEAQSRLYFEGYLPNGRPGEIVLARPNGSGEWAPAERRLFTYQGDQLQTRLTQTRSADGQEWLDERLLTYGYDGQGRMIARRVETATAPGEPLINDSRRLYAYNDADDITELLSQRWQDGGWQPVRRQQFTYTAQGEIQQRLLQTYTNGAWRNVGRRSWTYGPDDFSPTQVFTERWGIDADDWAPLSRRQLFYNAAGFWTGSLDQGWDETSQAWVNRYREQYSFSGQSQLESYLYQFWEDDEWINGVRETSFRDGLQFGNVVEQWDTLAAVWERQFRYRTTLNNDGLVAETVDRQFWDSDAEEWTNQNSTLRRTHFWSEVMVGVRDLPPPRACAVPNPYRKGQLFTCPELPPGNFTLELMDVTGRRVWERRFEGGNTFALNGHFPSGTYFLRIAGAATVHHLQKLVIID